MIPLNRGGAFIAALIVIVLVFFLFSLENSSRERLDRIGSAIDAVKAELFDAMVLETLDERLPGIEAKIDALGSSHDVADIVKAYSIGTREVNAGLEWPVSGSAVDRLRALDRFVSRVTREQRDSSNVLLWLLFTLAAIFVALFFWSEAVARRNLSKLEAKREFDAHLVAAIERERDLIAFDLHDSVLQKLGFIELRLGGSHSTCRNSAEIRGLVADSIRDLRGLYRDLREDGREGADPGSRLLELFEDYRALENASLDASVFGLETTTLSSSAWHHVIRIVQELLSNGYKHASASRITLRVYGLPGALRVLYADDGVGLPGDRPPRLASVEYRCEILGAALHCAPGDGGSGTAVKIEVPLA